MSDTTTPETAPVEDTCSPFTGMDYDEWLAYGLAQLWCGPPVCGTHDGVPMSESEEEKDDICAHVIRMYEDPEVAAAVNQDFYAYGYRR